MSEKGQAALGGLIIFSVFIALAGGLWLWLGAVSDEAQLRRSLRACAEARLIQDTQRLNRVASLNLSVMVALATAERTLSKVAQMGAQRLNLQPYWEVLGPNAEDSPARQDLRRASAAASATARRAFRWAQALVAERDQLIAKMPPQVQRGFEEVPPEKVACWVYEMLKNKGDSGGTLPVPVGLFAGGGEGRCGPVSDGAGAEHPFRAPFEDVGERGPRPSVQWVPWARRMGWLQALSATCHMRDLAQDRPLWVSALERLGMAPAQEAQFEARVGHPRGAPLVGRPTEDEWARSFFEGRFSVLPLRFEGEVGP